MNQAKTTISEEEKLIHRNESHEPAKHSEPEGDHGHTLSWRDINRVLFVAAAAVFLWFHRGSSSYYTTSIGVICTLVGGFPILHEAYENIVQRRMTMEL